MLCCAATRAAEPKTGEGQPASPRDYRGRLGEGNQKIRIENGRTYVWAGRNAKTGQDEWYDFTGAPFPAADLQFGIGKDRIRSIDDPLFVSADDPRLMKLPISRYRPDEKPKTSGDIMVIGWVAGDEARAYPTALLDRHELVNDKFGEKPVTVGW
jgi:hypothetical protein